ncbi:uncharacterized protein ATNIH1004_006234 [Aspergillus tanneri]|uniref:Uncharacterized protein n=1 Tax=Aspergillus tanneri TaxID=1220188 RepID=A0A5M9MQG2_9EURO|nr:uncharacterized protein ATNIH1004_006234 [Aspergillus tanneri]KAA8647540.1 hypothetical protein ATNIH1004_006234 [Aspergillus tanneri]
MSGFGKRGNDGHENYIVNHQVALPVPYNHGDGHEFSVNEPVTYGFPQSSFNSYTSHFTSPYNHPVLAPSHMHHLSPHHSPNHSIPSTLEVTALQHQSVQYMAHNRYLQTSRYLPLREALSETDIESQDSRNENTMLSEPVIPPLDGFPNVREFDQLMKR